MTHQRPSPFISKNTSPNVQIRQANKALLITPVLRETMMNRSILLKEAWTPHIHLFQGTDKLLKFELITKEKIAIRRFPNYTVWT